MPDDCAASKVGLDVHLVRWHQVYEVLVRLAFAAGVSHAQIIVIFDCDVKALPYRLAGIECR